MLELHTLADNQLPEYIKTLGYPTMLLVMIIEGPIATLVASFLSSLGLFNIVVVFFLSLLGDVLGDLVCYAIGFWGGSRMLERARKKLKIQPRIIVRMEKLFRFHGFKTIFAVKSTTGLCWITFIAAGAFRMNFKKFLQGSIGGGLIWSTFLVISGYFFGFAFLEISKYIKYSGFVLIILVVVLYFGISKFKDKRTRKLLSQNNNSAK